MIPALCAGVLGSNPVQFQNFCYPSIHLFLPFTDFVSKNPKISSCSCFQTENANRNQVDDKASYAAYKNKQ